MQTTRNFAGRRPNTWPMHLVAEDANVTMLAGFIPEAELDRWAEKIVSAAHEVHRVLGPGFTAAVYEEALCIELTARAIPFRRRVPVALDYKGKFIGHGEIRLLVGGRILVDVAIGADAAREPQVRSQLKATGCRLGLLIDFATSTPPDVHRLERKP